MKKLILTAGVSLVLAACGGGGESTGGLDQPELGAANEAQAPANTTPLAAAPLAAAPLNTSDIEVDVDFNLASSRSIDVDFDIADAEGTHASVSICTDYAQGGSAFDVNYDSCTVTADMFDGKFSHSMDVTHEFDSVVAVVWFLDPGTEPMYQEFFVDNATRSKGSKPSLVWR